MLFFSKNKDRSFEITVSNRTVVRVLIIVIASVLLLGMMRKAGHALTLIFVAFFLALALNAPVHWIAQRLPGRKRGSRSLATGVSFLIVILILIGFLMSILPPLIRQTSSFISAAPVLVEDFRDESTSVGSFVHRNNLDHQIDKLSTQVSAWADSLTGGTAVSTVTRITGNLVSILTVLVLTFMMLIEGPRWLHLGRRLISDEKQEWAEKMTRDMYKVIKGYVNGQVFLAATAAVLIAPALFILNISYPIALIVVVFICGLIPLVGHTIGAIIVSAVALFTSPWAALIILAYYITYQQIENYAIQPKIQANATDMSPLLVFSSVVIGASLNGLLGGLLAIPIAGCLRIIVLDYLTRKKYLAPKTASETV